MKSSSALQFYVSIGLLNSAVIGMFYSLSLPAPSITTTSVSDVVVMDRPQVALVVPVKQGVPVRVTVPSLAIDLPVGLGTYDAATGDWAVDTTQAYYATVSVPVNDSNGTTLIYGHAQAPIFAQLPHIQPGVQAIVTTDTGYAFHYRYQSMQQVLPSDTSILRVDGPPSLTLQTCMGDWDAYRGLFTFTLDSVQKL